MPDEQLETLSQWVVEQLNQQDRRIAMVEVSQASDPAWRLRPLITGVMAGSACMHGGAGLHTAEELGGVV
jgi:hypothetical protein